MKGVPLPVVRANQWVLIAGVLLALSLRAPALVVALFVVWMVPLILGPRAHLVGAVVRQVAGASLEAAPREDAGQQRFNQLLAAAGLALSSASFYVLHRPWLGWLLALALVGVAFAATRGT